MLPFPFRRMVIKLIFLVIFFKRFAKYLRCILISFFSASFTTDTIPKSMVIPNISRKKSIKSPPPFFFYRKPQSNFLSHKSFSIAIINSLHFVHYAENVFYFNFDETITNRQKLIYFLQSIEKNHSLLIRCKP